MQLHKLLLSAVLGGLAMFLWGAISHMVLPIYNSTLQSFTNEDAVTQSILANAPSSGTYFLPNIPSLPPGASEAEKEAAQRAMEARAEKGPQMFAFIRVGEFGSFGGKLLGELVADIIGVLILGWLFLRMGVTTMTNRLITATAVGFIIIFSGTMSHWIWYNSGFGYTLAETIDQVVGWFVAGLVVAKILPGVQSAS